MQFGIDVVENVVDSKLVHWV